MKTLIFIFIACFLSSFLYTTIINVPLDQPTIQMGITAATSHDTVLVQPGIYSQNITINKNIVLGSLFLTTSDTSFISTTIIHPAADVIVNFTGPPDSTCILTGFTISGGYSSGFGAGIRCVGTSPTIAYNIIRDNTVISNQGSFGGGILLEMNSTAKIIHNQILNNIATDVNHHGYGGGIYCSDSNPLLENNTISNNYAKEQGGGIYFLNSQLRLNNNIINQNNSKWGGGIYCEGVSSGVISGNTIYADSASYGGGIYLSTQGSLEFINNVVSSNWSDQYGGMYCSSTNSNIGNNTFCFNETITTGSALNLGSNIYNNIFTGNTGGLGAIFIVDTLNYNAFYGNDPADFYEPLAPGGAGVLSTVNINGDSCDVYNNIFMDPLFTDAANFDFHLTEFSPCIDAGDPTLPFDPDGTIADMGAYYFDQTTSLVPPQNVTVEIIGTEIHLSWDPVAGASSYKVYSSDDPFTGFTEDTTGTFAGENWSTSILNEKKFYYVVASSGL